MADEATAADDAVPLDDATAPTASPTHLSAAAAPPNAHPADPGRGAAAGRTAIGRVGAMHLASLRGPLRGALRHLVAATRWSLLAGAAVLVVGAVVLVARWPAALWPLHGAALGLVLGASAVAVDERCALVVDVGPRPLWWRTAVRAVGPVALVAVWAAAHGALRHDLPDHLGVLVGQGAVAAALGFGLATARRALGRAEPGTVLAATATPLIAAAALARPFEADLPLFPVWPHEDWARAALVWTLLGVVAAVVLARALHHDARRHPRGGV